MSVVRDLEITNNFYGILTTKGDLLTNDGNKNIRFGVGDDGYSLIADSKSPNGLKWELIGDNTQNSIEYFQYNLENFPFSTNNTSYVNIVELENIPESGNYVLFLSATYSLSKTDRSVTFAFYNNENIISSSSRNVETFIANKRISFHHQFTTTFSGSDILSVRLHTDNKDATVTLYDASLLLIKFTSNDQINIVNSDFSMNATIPIEIKDLTSIPKIGVYLIIFNCIFELTKNNRTITFGLYKNNTIIAGSEREYSALPNTKTVAQLSTIVSMSGEDISKVKVNVSNYDVDGIVYDMNIILIPLS